MKPIIKLNLGLIFLAAAYFFIRLIGISDIPLTIWQQVYYGNVIKNTVFLCISFYLIYYLFNYLRLNPKTGPTIIPARILKTGLIIFLILIWSAIAIHTVFDSLKIILPFNHLPLYIFSELMDETIAHLFMFLPTIGLFYLAALLEIERPLPVKLNFPEKFLIIITGFILGGFWGLNLSEGRLSLITSLPLMIIFAFLIIILRKKYSLKFSFRPWTLFSLIGSVSGSLGFSLWTLFFHSTPELFMVLK